MSTTRHHMKVDMAGAIRNRKEGGLKGYVDKDGFPLMDSEVFTEFTRRMNRGEKFFPMGDCKGFDPVTGCPGHEVPATPADAAGKGDK